VTSSFWPTRDRHAARLGDRDRGRRCRRRPLSTAAGLLLAISSAVSHDLLKGVFKPDISEKNELLAGRISMAGSIAVAGYLGFNPPGFAAGTVALASVLQRPVCSRP